MNENQKKICQRNQNGNNFAEKQNSSKKRIVNVTPSKIEFTTPPLISKAPSIVRVKTEYTVSACGWKRFK